MSAAASDEGGSASQAGGLSTLFARHPRITILAVFLIIASGVGAFFTLGRQEDPTLIERFGFVATLYPGAASERVEALVTEPLEDALMELAEIDEIRSRTRAGVSVVSVSLREDLNETEVDQAWSLVREQVDVARQSFPDGVLASEVNRQYIGAATMIVSVSWDDGREDAMGVLTRLALDLEDAFQGMSGTEETNIYGVAREEIRILANPDALAALGLTSVDVARIVAAADAKTPAGAVDAGDISLGVEIDGAFDSLDRVRSVPVIQRADGVVVRVADIARIEKGVRTPPEEATVINGKRSVMVAAFLTPGLRVDTWTQSARAVVDDFASRLPRGVSADIIFEQNQYANSRLSGLAVNLLVAAAIVFAVIFFVMGWRSALIVGSALPLTVLIVLFCFRLKGEPLHQMSVTGLVIALGLLIDNAIVMVDDYRLRRDRGLAPLAAVDSAVKHLFAPLLASTLTTIFAFAPIALQPGPTGEFIGMIGYSVIFSLIASFVVAMTIVPALAAWFDRGGVALRAEPQRFWRTGVNSRRLTSAYRRTLEAAARRPARAIALSLALPFIGFGLAASLPLQFFPPTDRDMFQLELVLPPEASIAQTRAAVDEADALIRRYDGVVSTGWVLGTAAPRVYYNVFSSRSSDPNYAAGWVRTRSPKDTARIVVDLQDRVRDAFPDAQFLALPFEQGPPVNAPVELELVGPDFATLDRLGGELRRIISLSADVTYTTAGLKLGAPVATLMADESMTRMAGRQLSEIASLVRADLDGVNAGSILEGAEELPVRILLDDDARGSLDALRAKLAPVPGGLDLGAPVASLGSVVLKPEVAVITRYMGQRQNAIYAYLRPYSLPAATMGEVQTRLAESDFTLPAGYTLSIGGEAAERGEAVAGLAASAAPLLVLILGALVLAFNSFRYAAVIGLVGFLAVGLAYFGVWMFGQPNGFNAIVGSMGLIGLAINGAIVVLSSLRSDPAALAGELDAVVSVTVDATRHIVATTLTTIGGFIPLLLSGDSFWIPLAAAIAGGVAGSAVLALYLAPACFILLERARARTRARLASLQAARRGAAGE